MCSIVSLGRVALLLVLSAVLAACTQIGASTYYGRLGPDTGSLTKQQKAKILAARKRAAVIRARDARKNAAKRRARLKKQRSTQTALLAEPRKTKRKASKREAFKSKGLRKNAARAGKKAKLRRRGRAGISKGKRRQSKRKSSAFVGSRSRSVAWNAPRRCVPGRLKRVLAQVARKYGRVTVSSSHRSHRHNRRVGGKRKSYHLSCRAVDFRVHGRTRGLTRWLARHPSVGGFKRYR
ncbi:MAG: D-Ala-D-Ala carboxypeptidase family metallohydrolase, partial [Rhizobiaceae bacterium]